MATGLLRDTASLPMQSVHGYRTEAYSIGLLELIDRILLSHEGASDRIEIGFTGKRVLHRFATRVHRYGLGLT